MQWENVPIISLQIVFLLLDNHINIFRFFGLLFSLSVLEQNSPLAKLNLMLKKMNECSMNYMSDNVLPCGSGQLSFEISFLLIASVEAL